MFKHWFLFSFLLVQLIGGELFAQNNEVSAAIMQFSRTKGVDVEFAETISSIVRNEAQQIESYDVVDKLPIEFNDILLALGCNADSNTCLKESAAQMGAQILVFGNIRTTAKGVQISVQVFDSNHKKVTKHLRRNYNKNEDPLVDFRKDIQIFFGKQKASKTILVDSNISKAKVYLNNRFVGNTPIQKLNLNKGNSQIRVEAKGFKTWQIKFTVDKNSPSRVWAKLEKTENNASKDPVIKDPTKPNIDYSNRELEPLDDTMLNWGAIGTTGVGLALITTSLVFIALMKDTENTIESERNSNLQKEKNYNQRKKRYNQLLEKGEKQELLQFIFLGAGTGVTMVGLAWFALSPSNKEHSIRFQVSPQMLSATLSF